MAIEALQRGYRDNVRPYLVESDQDFLYEIKRFSPLPKQISGVGLNIPFAWDRSHDQKQQTFEFADKLGIDKFRMLPESEFKKIEPKLGIFNEELLDRQEQFITEAKNYNIIYPFADGYWMFHSNKWNPMYSPKPLNSCYLADTSSVTKISESQSRFFTDETYINAYQKRMALIIKRFGNYPNVTFELINEGNSQNLDANEAIEENTRWYSKMTAFARSCGVNTVLMGTADPNSIDYSRLGNLDGVVATGHPYIYSPKTYPIGSSCVLEDYTEGKVTVPGFVEEIGAPHHFFKYIVNPVADVGLKNLMIATIKDSIVDGTCHNAGLYLWHGDVGHTKDNLLITNAKYSKSLRFIMEFNNLVKLL